MQDYINEKLAGSASATTLSKRIPFLLKLSGTAKDFSFLNNTKKVLARLNESNNINTKWGNLWHVIMAIRSDPDATSQATKDYYLKLAEQYRIVRDATIANNVKTEKQKITLAKSLTEYQNELRAKIKNLFESDNYEYKPFKRVVSWQFASSLQDLVTMAVYLLQPALRNDWAQLHIVKSTTKLTNNKNYLYTRGKVMRLIMSVYKNSKSMGKQVINIKPELAELLLIWFSVIEVMTKEKPKYVLQYTITKDKFEYVDSDDAMRRNIPRIAQRVFNINLSINDMRHLWEINYQTDPKYATLTQAEKNELHRELLHSSAIAQLYNVQ